MRRPLSTLVIAGLFVLAATTEPAAVQQSPTGISYPVNTQCDPGYHIVNKASPGFAITLSSPTASVNLTPLGVGGSFSFPTFPGFQTSIPGKSTPICVPNDPNIRVAAGPTSTPAPGMVDNALKQAQQEFDAAKERADAALLELERCQQKAAQDAADHPDGVQHSPGYTGRGQGLDRNARKIDREPCQREQAEWDSAHSAFQAALQKLLYYQSLKAQSQSKTP